MEFKKKLSFIIFGVILLMSYNLLLGFFQSLSKLILIRDITNNSIVISLFIVSNLLAFIGIYSISKQLILIKGSLFKKYLFIILVLIILVVISSLMNNYFVNSIVKIEEGLDEKIIFLFEKIIIIEKVFNIILLVAFGIFIFRVEKESPPTISQNGSLYLISGSSNIYERNRRYGEYL